MAKPRRQEQSETSGRQSSLLLMARMHTPASAKWSCDAMRHWRRPALLALLLFLVAALASCGNESTESGGGVKTTAEAEIATIQAAIARDLPQDEPTRAKPGRLCEAMRSSDPDAVRQLTASGLDANTEGCHGEPPLFEAVRSAPEMVRILVDEGADVNAKDRYGDPLLRWAIRWSTPAIVKILVEAGADVNARDRWGDSPLKWASLDESDSGKEFLQILLDAGAEVDFPPELPHIRVIDRSDSSITIEVLGSGDVETHYAVRRRNATESEEWVDMEVRGAKGIFEDQRLSEDTTYYYALQACNAVGCSRLSSETVGVTESSGQVSVPEAPSLRGEVLPSFWDTSIELSWNAIDEATFYWVYRINNSTYWEVSAPRTMFNSSDHIASYQVKACNKAGCSPFSNIVTGQ